MISQRLRGVKEDGEAIEEAGFMPKLKAAFGEVGVSIEDENGELRSTFDILNDLAGVWDQLSSKQQQFLGEKAAGNRQVKTLNAIMANWDVVQDTIQKANEATGEGTKGNEKYLDSIQGRITEFKSAFSNLSREIIDSDLVKFLVSAGTSFLTGITDFVGVINSVLSPFAKVISSFVDSFRSVTFKSIKDGLSSTRETISVQKSGINNLNTELTNTEKLISDLESKGPLTLVEQEELQRLRDVNKELQANIALENAKLKIAEREHINEAANAYATWATNNTSSGKYESVDYDKQRTALETITNISGVSGANKFVNQTIKAQQKAGVTTEYNDNTDRINNAQKAIDYSMKAMEHWQKRISELSGQYLDSIKTGDEAAQESSAKALELAKAKKDFFEVIYQQNIAELNEYSDQLSQLIGDIPYIENPQTQFEALVKQMQDLKRAADEAISTYSNVGQNTTEGANAGGSAEEEVSVLSELIKNNFKLTESYKTLTAAMSEQEKAGVITMETYQALMDDEGLPGIQEYLTLTAEGFALNTEGIYDYIKAMNDEMKVKLLDELADKKQALEELVNALSQTTDEQERASKATQAEQLQNDIDALQAYINSLDTATGALERYRAAQKAPQGDENYNEGQNALKDIKEGWKSGKVGTPKYQEAMGFFLGENWRTNEQYQGEKGQQKAQKDAEKLGNRYFKDERTGVNNFIKDLEKLDKVSDKVNFTEDGKLEITDDTSIQEIAQGLSEVTGNAEMSEDAVTSLFELLQTYTPDKFDWSFLNPPEDPNVTQRKKELQDAKDAGTAERDRLIQERNAAENKGDTNKVEKLNQQISEADKNLATLDQQLEEVGSNTEFNLETSSINELQNKLQNVQDLIVWLQGIGVTNVEANLTGTADEISKEIEDRIKELKGENSNVDITINGNGENAEGAINSVEEGLAEVGMGADAPLYATDKTASSNIGKVEEKLEVVGQGADAPLYATDKTAEGVKKAEESINGIDPDTVEIQGNASGVEDAAGDANKAINDIDEPDDVEFDGNADGVEDAANDATGAVNTFGNLPPPEAIPLQAEDKASEASEGASSAVNTFGMLPPPDAKELKAENKTQEGIDEAKGNLYTYEADKYNSTIGAIPDNASITSVSDQLDDAARNRDSTITVTLKDSDGNEWTPEQYQNYRDKNYRPDPDEDPNGYGLPLIKKGSTPNSYSEPNPPLSQEMLEEFRIGYEASLENPDAISEEAQEAADSNPIEMPMELEPPEEPVEVEVEYETPVEPVPGSAPSPAPTPTPTPTPAPSSGSTTMQVDTVVNDSAVEAYEPENKDSNVYYHPDFSAMNGLKGPDLKGTINYTANITGNAKGTDYAAKGPSLVDEEGAELIEHTKRGTYELGTNNGARMTYLDKGDVVHTARETKTILSRMAKVGGFFRDGLNKGKSIIGGAFARGISGSISLSNIKRVLSSSRKSINGGTKGSNSSSASGTSNKKFKKWAEKLFDWAEIRLARLKTVTNGWLLSAAEAIGYMAQNAELTNALGAVEDEIEATTAAYDLYIKQADEVQKRAKLSDDIVEKIKQGNIEISSYKKEIQEKIKEYQKWYEKALACSDALNDLREQERDLAKQKLDNILTHYNNRIDRLDNVVRQRESDLALAEAQGRELQASEYDTSISATTQKYEELIAQRDALVKEMNQLISQGLIDKESDTWHEYTGKLEDAENAITETRTAIIELHDEANKVELTKLGYQLDALANTAAHITDLMDLHASQVAEEMPEVYKDLIDNGMEQIKNLEEQNEELRKQQEGLDVLSQKYQDLEEQIQSNISTINQMKVSQEQWNDSVLDLKIAQLEKYRDSLNKMNDQYERQKELQEAIEELQKVQGQRTQRVFKSGVGFVYEADQDTLKDAQENLENVIKDQLLSRIDDLIDALEEEKNNTNVYDYEGNLLGTEYSLPQLGTLTEILSGYYNSNVVPNFSGLKGSLYDQIIAGANNNNSMQFNFGDINLSEVNDVNTLGEAIVDLLPNAILQAINKKG